MLHYKPQTQAVEITPAKNKQPVSLKRRFIVLPDGTVSPAEDKPDWDFDKSNNLGE